MTLDRTGILLSALLMLLGSLSATARPAMTLTNAADVLALPDGMADQGIPVSVTGVVTVAQFDWDGRFFLQDSSGGVFVENRTNQPSIGDIVAVTGITRAGGYAPCITKPHWAKIGTAPLPAAKPVTIEQLMSGTEDSQRIEITGVVRDSQLNDGLPEIELVSGGYRFWAYLPASDRTNLRTLIGAKVLLKGTVASAYNAQLRHIINVTLYVPQSSDFIIEEPAPGDPYAEPLTRLNAIAQYRKDRQPGSQVHVKGVVTYQRKGEDLFLRDSSGGLEVKTKLDESVAQGEVIEAVGFPAVENFLPVLEDADFRKTGEIQPHIQPLPVMVADLQKGLHHGEYIALEGTLVDRLARGIGLTPDGPVFRTTLVLQNSNFLFEAEKDTTEENNYLAAIPIGSVVLVSGICMLESDDGIKAQSVRILLPTSHDVHVLKQPGWLTPEHLLASLAAVSAVLVLVGSWSVIVSNKNLRLKSLVSEKEAAQKELQEAHDQLEWRVEERTKQLKVEMTARKESELQFRAVLTERTRLAQELHDTLEQTITGIALQLDRVASYFGKNSDTASHHLKLARNLTRQGQTEVRQSVWGLRTRAAEKFNLVNALTVTGRQIANGAGIQVRVETSGEMNPLSETFEENLLRIGQEAVTNAVKHSGAGTVKIELQFTPEHVVLQIRDDGKGFDPDHCIGPDEGHFGLLGIRERAERMGGNASISSAPGAGACVRVDIPNPQNNESQPQPDFET
ncbi:MAG TPA: ATP-binding protein [Candidatus Sulfotelmatobacter sp.]|nr:ATP-binding protein [Candidatus Sulfotelmatobacter sp.]